MKIESKKWKHYSEKCNHCCEINLIFNRKLSYKHFHIKSPNKTNWERKRFYQLEISLTQLTFFRGTRGNLYPKKKGIRSSSYRVSSSSSSTKQWISEEKTGKFQASNRLPLSIIFLAREELDSKSFFFPKRRKKYRGEKAPSTFDAFGNVDRSARKSEKVRKITTKRTRN